MITQLKTFFINPLVLALLVIFPASLYGGKGVYFLLSLL